MGCNSTSQVIDCKAAKDLLSQKEELIDYLERVNVAPTDKQRNQMILFDIDFSEQMTLYAQKLGKAKSTPAHKQLSLLKKHFNQLSIRWKYLTGLQSAPLIN